MCQCKEANVSSFLRIYTKEGNSHSVLLSHPVKNKIAFKIGVIIFYITSIGLKRSKFLNCC